MRFLVTKTAVDDIFVHFTRKQHVWSPDVITEKAYRER